MDNKIELYDWEMMLLDRMYVKLENGVMSDEGGQNKINFEKMDMQPFLLRPGESNTDSAFDQKIELHFKGYYRHIILTRYGKKPGPMTVIVGENDVYKVEEQEYDNGLKRVVISRGFDQKEVSIEVIPNYTLPNGENTVLLTRFSNVHSLEQKPEYVANIICTPNSLTVDALSSKDYYHVQDYSKLKEVTIENYKKLVQLLIIHNHGNNIDDKSEQLLEFIPFLLRAFEAATKYNYKSILEAKKEKVNKACDEEIVVLQEKISAINEVRKEKLKELEVELDSMLTPDPSEMVMKR